jgi:hypothetical protein
VKNRVVQDEFPLWQNVMQMSRHIERTSAKGDTITKQHDTLHTQRTENHVLKNNLLSALSEKLTDENSSSNNEADNIDEYSQSMRNYESRQKRQAFCLNSTSTYYTDAGFRAFHKCGYVSQFND